MTCLQWSNIFYIFKLNKAMFQFNMLVLGTYVFFPKQLAKLHGLFCRDKAGDRYSRVVLNHNYFTFPRRFIRLNRFFQYFLSASIQFKENLFKSDNIIWENIIPHFSVYLFRKFYLIPRHNIVFQQKTTMEFLLKLFISCVGRKNRRT